MNPPPAAAPVTSPTSSFLGRHKGKLTAAVAVLCGVLVLRVLWRQDWGAIFETLRTTDLVALWPAYVFIVLSFLALTGYDFVAIRLAGHKIPAVTTVLKASFVGTVFAMNFGFTALSGTAVRAFYYGRAGIPARGVAAVLACMALTFALGWLALFGFALAVWPGEALSATLGVPPAMQRLIGVVLLAGLAGYLAACALRWRPSIGRFGWQLPSLPQALAQLAVSVADSCLAGAVLYVILPVGDLPFLAFMGAFLTAAFAGLASHVPGGFGVIEVTLMRLLGPVAPASEILAGMVLYRLFNFVLPLIPAGLLFLGDIRAFAASRR